MLLAAASEGQAFWLIALGIGAVVILVVIALLTLLLRVAKDIDSGVATLTATTAGVAGNTAAIMELPATADVLRDIRDETMLHDEFLRGR